MLYTKGFEDGVNAVIKTLEASIYLAERHADIYSNEKQVISYHVDELKRQIESLKAIHNIKDDNDYKRTEGTA